MITWEMATIPILLAYILGLMTAIQLLKSQLHALGILRS